MGAEVFFTVARGNTAREAFETAVEDAQYEFGHGGYSGTIAEKSSFTMIPFSGKDVTPMEFADVLIERSDPRIDDKWGPAGCIEITDIEEGAAEADYSVGEGPRKFLFFGWASS